MRTLRRMISGYTDMGPIRIPPLPANTILTDRGDGTLWQLTHDSTGQYLGIESAWPSRYKDLIVYSPYNGPRLGEEGRIQIFVRNGNLGFEFAEYPQGITDMDNPRLLTRRGVEHIILEIVLPTNWSSVDPDATLAYEISTT